MHSQEQKQVRELGKSRNLFKVHLLFFPPYALFVDSIQVGVSLSTNWLFGILNGTFLTGAPFIFICGFILKLGKVANNEAVPLEVCSCPFS